METTPLLSVIVPVYKVEKYLPKCVESILNQSFRELELLLVDDGSPDGCGRLCEEYARADSRVRVFHRENGGQGQARNLGLEEARGRYFSFVDSDDWLEPDAYRQMLAGLTAENAQILCAGRYNVDEKTGDKARGLCPEKAEVIGPREMLRRIFLWEGCDSSPCDKIFQASLFEGLRFPAESGSEDVAILYRLVDRAEKIVMLPEPVYNYLQRAGSTSYGALNPKIFNFERNTGPLYAFVREQYPEIRDAARYLRVRSLVYSVQSVEIAEEDSRRPWIGQMRKSRKALRRHLGFLLTSPLFGKQERLTDILLALGLYRPLRTLYHRGS